MCYNTFRIEPPDPIQEDPIENKSFDEELSEKKKGLTKKKQQLPENPHPLLKTPSSKAPLSQTWNQESMIPMFFRLKMLLNLSNTEEKNRAI